MKTKISFLLILCLFLTGCETVKMVLGTSTRHLQKARREAAVGAYSCSFDDCFDAVLSLAHNEYAGEPVSEEKFFHVFQKNRIKSFIVVMNVPGNINTTEVGIFFIEAESNKTQIEISSLSSAAKQKVARRVFKELGMRFNSAQ